ncbi:hypothetical protein JOE39_000875 [Pseudomonas sp. PvP100]|nr:hypothetical protein [Pseudomonas sp. PvP007]MBP1192896.1 hypothetical protein [Pseudomonas sp. PvP100]
MFLKFAFMNCAEIKIHTPPQLELAKWFCASFARVLRRPEIKKGISTVSD